MMTSAQVVETSVNTNNSPQDYTTNPDDHLNHDKNHIGFYFGTQTPTPNVTCHIRHIYLLLTFKALHGLAPIYIRGLTFPPLSTLNYLSVPKSNTATYGDRCFSVAAPKLWNSLPSNFRFIENPSTFKTSIKTWLFRSVFNLI